MFVYMVVENSQKVDMFGIRSWFLPVCLLIRNSHLEKSGLVTSA